MAVNEGIRKTSQAYVVSLTPDVCMTPMGPKQVPVPYDIIAMFGDSCATVPTVLIKGNETFTSASFIQGVKGNEPGVGGGLMSGVFAIGGVCSAVPGTESQFVQAKDNFVVYHTTTMQMNAPAPAATGNTRGKAVFQAGSNTVTVDPSGKVSGDTNPKDKPENENELKTRVREEDQYKATEAKSEAGASGHQDRYNTSNEPGAKDIKPTHETGIKFEKKTFDGSVIESPDGNLKVGNLTGTKSFGAGYDHEAGAFKAGAGLEGGFSTIKVTTGQGTALGGLATGNVDAELLTAKGGAGVELTAGSGKVALEGKAGLEVIVAEATAKGALKITGKTLWDNTVGALIKSTPRNVYNPLLQYGEAPASWDKGIEIGVSGTIGVGAAAEVSGKVGYDKDAAPGKKKLGAEFGAKLGLGPKAGVKTFFGLIF